MSTKRGEDEKIEAYARALIEAGRSEGRANADLVQWQHARKFSPEVLETLSAMHESDDLGLVDKVARQYKEILDDELRAKVKAKAESDLKAPVYLVERVDPSILGGIVFEARGKRFDASVRAQLANIRKTLSSTFIGSDEQ